MSNPRAHVQFVTGRLQPLSRSLPVIQAALAHGIDSVQLRDSGPSISATLRALKLEDPSAIERVVVNGEPKVAGSYAVRWLHLPGSWLESTPPFARFARVGLSVHSIEEAYEAEALGADYVTFGNVFSTATHPGRTGQGLTALTDIVERLSIPVLAIGGITIRNAADALATGCAGVVVHAAIADQPDPGLATERLIEAVEASAVRPETVLPEMPPIKRKGTSS